MPQKFTSLKRTTKSELIDDLMGYNADERSRDMYTVSSQKWICRKEGKIYEKETLQIRKKTPNLCKYQPKAMIKYINMQTSLCPECKRNDVTIRCSREHLEKCHNIRIADEYEIISKVTDFRESQRRNNRSKENPVLLKRGTLLEFAESLIEPNIEKLKTFLNKSD